MSTPNNELADWIAFIYNLRGYEMTDMVWAKFSAFVETRPDIFIREPRFETLKGGLT